MARAKSTVTSMGRCRIDGFRVEVVTHPIQRTRFVCPGCTRRRAGQCMDCGRPVRGKAWRCPQHVTAARRKAGRHWDERNRGERKRLWKQYRKRMSPEQRERRKAQHRAWRAANVVRCKLQKQKGRLAGTWGYRTREAFLEAQRRRYRLPGRQAKLVAYRRLHAVYRDGPPRCRFPGCAELVAWRGAGAAPYYCPGHRTAASRRQAA